MTDHEWFIDYLNSRKPQFDELVADMGVLEARRHMWEFVGARTQHLDMSGPMADFAKWWDANYSEVN